MMRIAALLVVLLVSAWGCHDGVFGVPLGGLCDASTPCEEPYACALGRCRPACTSDADCVPGACLDSAQGKVCSLVGEDTCDLGGECAAGGMGGGTGGTPSSGGMGGMQSSGDGGSGGDAGGGCESPCCGDGVKNGNEACDGSDLAGASCASEKAPGWVGMLACSEGCEIEATACTTPATTYYDVDSAGLWDTFDTTTINNGARGFSGAAFDGRYLYFAPQYAGGTDSYSGLVARYDTQAAFGAAASWDTFDVATVNGGAEGFAGAAFDGRYLYLVPYHNDVEYHGIVARYDTQADFGTAASWDTFDVATVNSGAKGFKSAAFDGRYLYLVPEENPAYNGLVARYDTTAPFGTAASWEAFDVTAVNSDAKGFQGAAFDGHHLYLVPRYNGVGYSGLVARYDTTAAFGTTASWDTFDVGIIDSGAKGFQGGAFDGRYLYLVPSYNGLYISGLVARYDTQADFGTAASWDTFDVTTVDGAAKGFAGAAFDGRYLYLVPQLDGVYHGNVARYDTLASFTTAESWDTFDVATVNSGAKGFVGAAFDGRYVYLSPSFNAVGTPDGIVARFEAKSPAWLPVGWNASFY